MLFLLSVVFVILTKYLLRVSHSELIIRTYFAYLKREDYSLQARYYLNNMKKIIKKWKDVRTNQIKTCYERISGWQKD